MNSPPRRASQPPWTSRSSSSPRPPSDSRYHQDLTQPPNPTFRGYKDSPLRRPCTTRKPIQLTTKHPAHRPTVTQAELNEANATRRELAERVELKNVEIAERNKAAEDHLAKLVAAQEERSRVEAQLREANNKQAAFESAKARMEQQQNLLQQHNEWLRAELTKKSDELLTARKAASADALAAANELEQFKKDCASAVRDLGGAKEEASRASAAASRANEELRGARESAARAEAHFDKELVTAKRLAELYKKQADTRGAKTTELEGVLQALRDHLAEVKEEHAAALREADAKCKSAEKAAAAAAAELESRAPHSGAPMSPNENALPAPTLGDDGAASGRQAGALLAMRLPDTAAASLRRENLTMTELYSKYAEAADAWRKECAERRRLQATIDGMLQELEQRAPMLAEQRREYERAVAAHAEMRLRLEDSTIELRRMETDARAHAADKRHHERVAKGLEAQSADLSRQVQLLLNEVTELKGGAPSALAPKSVAAGDAAAVVTATLVDFKDIATLQEQNRRQIEVIRTLSADQEELGQRLRDEYESEAAKLRAETKKSVEDIEGRTSKTQTMVDAVTRQRDMYKALYASASVPGGAATADAAAMSLAAAAAASLAKTEHAALPAGSSDANAAQQLVQLNAELQQELAKQKEESAANADLLRKQADEHRGVAATAKAEAAAAKAQAEFERSRYASLQESADAARKDVETLVEKNSSASRRVAEHEAALREQQARLDAAEDKASRAESAARRAESERQLLAQAEQRAAETAAKATAEKSKLEAARDAALSMKEVREREIGAERERLATELARLQKDWAAARTDLDTERERTRTAAAAAAAAAEKAASRAAADEAAAQTLRDAKSDATTRAQVAEEKCKILEQQLKKADERVRVAMAPRLGHASGGTGASVQAEAAGVVVAAEHGAAETPREMELLAAAMRAGEDAATAREAVTAAEGHVAHYRAIAEANDAAIKEMQAAFDALKSESEKNKSDYAAESEALRARASEAENSAASKWQKRAEDAEAKAKLVDDAQVEAAEAKREATAAATTAAAAEGHVAALAADVEEHRKQWRQAQQMYEQELLHHAEDVKKLNAEEQRRAEELKSVEAARERAATADVRLTAAESKWAEERGAMEKAKRDAEANTAALSSQNQLLHNQLEDALKAAREVGGAGGDGGEAAEKSLHEVIAFLRSEKEAATCQLEVVSLEFSRWKREAETARTQADAARATLVELENTLGSKGAADGEAKHASLMAKVEHLNVVQESNSTLRAELTGLKTQLADAKKAVATAAATVEQANKEAAEAKAVAEGAAGERELLQADARRWEERTTQLLEKYGQVDLAEHNRVKEALEKAEQSANEQVAAKVAELEAKEKEAEAAAAQLAAVTAKAEKDKSQLDIAKKHISMYNPGKFPLPKWKQEQAQIRASLAELQASSAAWEKEKSEMAEKLETAAAAARTALTEGDESAVAAAVAAASAEWEKEKAALEAKATEGASADGAATAKLKQIALKNKQMVTKLTEQVTQVKSQADEAASNAKKERDRLELRLKILEQEKASLERKAAGSKSPVGGKSPARSPRPSSGAGATVAAVDTEITEVGTETPAAAATEEEPMEEETPAVDEAAAEAEAEAKAKADAEAEAKAKQEAKKKEMEELKKKMAEAEEKKNEAAAAKKAAAEAKAKAEAEAEAKAEADAKAAAEPPTPAEADGDAAEGYDAEAFLDDLIASPGDATEGAEGAAAPAEPAAETPAEPPAAAAVNPFMRAAAGGAAKSPFGTFGTPSPAAAATNAPPLPPGANPFMAATPDAAKNPFMAAGKQVPKPKPAVAPKPATPGATPAGAAGTTPVAKKSTAEMLAEKKKATMLQQQKTAKAKKEKEDMARKMAELKAQIDAASSKKRKAATGDEGTPEGTPAAKQLRPDAPVFTPGGAKGAGPAGAGAAGVTPGGRGAGRGKPAGRGLGNPKGATPPKSPPGAGAGAATGEEDGKKSPKAGGAAGGAGRGRGRGAKGGRGGRGGRSPGRGGDGASGGGNSFAALGGGE